MVNGEWHEELQVLKKDMKTMDSDLKQIYTFRVERANEIKTTDACSKMKEDITKRMEIITEKELINTNVIIFIITKVIPIATYAINVLKFVKWN